MIARLSSSLADYSLSTEVILWATCLVQDYHERDEDDLSLPSLKSMSIHQPTIRTNINSYGGGSYGNEVPGNHINSQSYGLNSRGNQGGRGSRRRR